MITVDGEKFDCTPDEFSTEVARIRANSVLTVSPPPDTDEVQEETLDVWVAHPGKVPEFVDLMLALPCVEEVLYQNDGGIAVTVRYSEAVEGALTRSWKTHAYKPKTPFKDRAVLTGPMVLIAAISRSVRQGKKWTRFQTSESEFPCSFAVHVRREG